MKCCDKCLIEIATRQAYWYIPNWTVLWRFVEINRLPILEDL